MKNTVAAEQGWGRRRLYSLLPLRLGVRRLPVSDGFFYAALLIVALIAACAAVPSWIAPYAPTDMRTDEILRPPSAGHWLGTDYFGRDVLSLVIHGSRDSLLIGLTSVILGGLAGGIAGSLSAYAGGVTDKVTMRIVDVLMTIPSLLLALAIAAALGPSLFNIVLAVSIAAIPRYARVMRGQVLAVKGRPYVTAARSIGASHLRIYVRHVLPNSLSPLLVMATIGIASSILVASSLSFLGLGVLKEVPDWGTLLSQGRGYITVAWWIATFPGLAITVLVLAINLVGDRLRDALDPKRSRW
ncbi:ABC transporter permease [Paenibacillus puerhi]|uniref:ABC transporter permease n=1 Tax=Paenibacillus puerhi TaxID=2692622 RepID=UPI001357DC7E|nr:ABC transporter permease [Paenibacillus puerhi]